jgi:RNA polymerase sigma-70 factor (ECF subfamily)
MDESNLINAARRGDLDAFNKLVLKYQDLVFQRAFWIMHEAESADDATQEAFIKAFRNLSRYRSGSFRAWMLRIVTNTCYDELRRRKRSRTVSFVQPAPDGSETDLLDVLFDPDLSIEKNLDQLEMLADLSDLINKLPEEFRETLILVDVLELTYEEAASLLSVPMGTVKSRLARARKRLRKQIAPDKDFTPRGNPTSSMGISIQ